MIRKEGSIEIVISMYLFMCGCTGMVRQVVSAIIQTGLKSIFYLDIVILFKQVRFVAGTRGKE